MVQMVGGAAGGAHCVAMSFRGEVAAVLPCEDEAEAEGGGALGWVWTCTALGVGDTESLVQI
jgi:hypothetical protein